MADIGCGQGTSTILMAERFPASAFTGFDHSDALIAAARKAAADAGMSDWVSFEVADATSFPASPDGYNLVTFTDCLHDLGDPAAAAAHARSVLAPGGTTISSSRSPPTGSRTTSATRMLASATPSRRWCARRPRSPSPGWRRSGRWPARPGCGRCSPTPATRECAGWPRRRRRSTSCWRPGHERADVPRRAHFDGDPGELLPAYHRLLERFGIDNLDVHLCVVRDDGLTVFDACRQGRPSTRSSPRATCSARPWRRRGCPHRASRVSAMSRWPICVRRSGRDR